MDPCWEGHSHEFFQWENRFPNNSEGKATRLHLQKVKFWYHTTFFIQIARKSQNTIFPLFQQSPTLVIWVWNKHVIHLIRCENVLTEGVQPEYLHTWCDDLGFISTKLELVIVGAVEQM